jgi:hypothetical protein
VGLGTLCLNLNPHLCVWSSPLPNLNPEVWVQFRCKPSAPEVQDLIWVKYGNRSHNFFPSEFLNLRCSSGSHPVLEVHKPNHRQSILDTSKPVGWDDHTWGYLDLQKPMDHLKTWRSNLQVEIRMGLKPVGCDWPQEI